MIKNSNPKKTKYVITHANILGTFLSSNFFTKGSNNHAIINPIKNPFLNFSFSLSKTCETIAVKKGATHIITPTFEAEVYVSAIFSNK